MVLENIIINIVENGVSVLFLKFGLYIVDIENKLVNLIEVVNEVVISG